MRKRPYKIVLVLCIIISLIYLGTNYRFVGNRFIKNTSWQIYESQNKALYQGEDLKRITKNQILEDHKLKYLAKEYNSMNFQSLTEINQFNNKQLYKTNIDDLLALYSDQKSKAYNALIMAVADDIRNDEALLKETYEEMDVKDFHIPLEVTYRSYYIDPEEFEKDPILSNEIMDKIKESMSTTMPLDFSKEISVPVDIQEISLNSKKISREDYDSKELIKRLSEKNINDVIELSPNNIIVITDIKGLEKPSFEKSKDLVALYAANKFIEKEIKEVQIEESN